LADDYFKRALDYAKLFEEKKEEEKPGLLCAALSAYSHLRSIQGKYDEAVAFAEQAYDIVAIFYNPVHPKVQEAAGTLIQCLSRKGDYYDSERFAEAVLSSLKDPKNGVNQNSEEVAQGYSDLGNVIYLQGGDYLKAETLIRESLRIRSLLNDNEHQNVGLSVGLLASILKAQGKLGNETKELMDRSLAIDTKHFGPDGVNTAISTARIGAFYHQLAETTSQSADSKINYLRLSETSFKEALRINMKTRGPNHSGTMDVSSKLSIVSLRLMELNSIVDFLDFEKSTMYFLMIHDNE
jgi:tetratricopeptide (TPR) repeat protein